MMSYEEILFLEIRRYVHFHFYKGDRIALQSAYSGIEAFNFLILRIGPHRFWLILIVAQMIIISFTTCREELYR